MKNPQEHKNTIKLKPSYVFPHRLTVLSLLAVASLPLPSTAEASPSTATVRHRRAAVEFLSAVNAARGEVGVPLLSWNATVAQIAKAHMNWLRASGGCGLRQMNRSPVPLLGGLTTFSYSNQRRTPADAVQLWVDKRQWYDHAANTCAPGKQCLEYKLVVTRAWQQLGCAVVACNSGTKLVMACVYSPGTNRLPNPKDPPY